jgi:hypothetical protein
MADVASSDGSGVWKSIDTIAEMSEMGRSTVKRALSDLEESELIRRSGSRRVRGGDVIVWDLNLEAISTLEKLGVILNPGSERTSTQVHSDPQPGSTVTHNTPLEPPIESSIHAREVFDFYNSLAAKVGWTKSNKLTAKLKSAINARVSDHGADNVKAFLLALSKLEWTFKGFPGKPEFRASLVYVMRPRTFAEHFDKLAAGFDTKRSDQNPIIELGMGPDGRMVYRDQKTGREFVFGQNGKEYFDGGTADQPGDAGSLELGFEQIEREPSQDMPVVLSDEEEETRPVPQRHQERDACSGVLPALRSEWRS